MKDMYYKDSEHVYMLDGFMLMGEYLNSIRPW